jgi:hypothetical protein
MAVVGGVEHPAAQQVVQIAFHVEVPLALWQAELDGLRHSIGTRNRQLLALVIPTMQKEARRPGSKSLVTARQQRGVVLTHVRATADRRLRFEQRARCIIALCTFTVHARTQLFWFAHPTEPREAQGIVRGALVITEEDSTYQHSFSRPASVRAGLERHRFQRTRSFNVRPSDTPCDDFSKLAVSTTTTAMRLVSRPQSDTHPKCAYPLYSNG